MVLLARDERSSLAGVADAVREPEVVGALDVLEELGRGLGLVVTGFVAFRVLDVLKPPPIRWAERSFAGGLGVMLDDVVAGAMAALITAAAAAALGGGA